MTPQVAMNALKFLERATLTGPEIQAYLEVRQSLAGIAAPDQVPTSGQGPVVEGKGVGLA